MTDTAPNLPDDVDALQAMVMSRDAEIFDLETHENPVRKASPPMKARRNHPVSIRLLREEVPHLQRPASRQIGGMDTP